MISYLDRYQAFFFSNDYSADVGGLIVLLEQYVYEFQNVVLKL